MGEVGREGKCLRPERHTSIKKRNTAVVLTAHTQARVLLSCLHTGGLRKAYVESTSPLHLIGFGRKPICALADTFPFHQIFLGLELHVHWTVPPFL